MSKATTSAPLSAAPRAAPVSARARALVRGEFVRAGADLLALPLRAGRYLAHRDRERAELLAALATTAEPAPVPPFEPPTRPLRLFVSCAEASGEIHAVNAVRELRGLLLARRAPAARFTGLGGARLAAEGVEIVDDVVADARMGIGGVVGALPRYLDLLRRTVDRIEHEKPDALLMVDSPALHVPLGRMARALGVPVVHFVTPQYWGWAPWRVKRYAEAVDLGLSILPFEPAWYAAHDARVAHVGHPLLDELADVERGDPDRGTDLVLLPGSRAGVVRRNLAWMLRAVEPLVRAGTIPGVVIPHGRAEMDELLRAEVARAGAGAWARIETGDLHAELRRARAAFSVSGTVLLDLLHHDLPTVVVYRLGSRFAAEGKDHLLTAPWFSSINLLAGSEVVPEFSFHGSGPLDRVRSSLAAAWSDEAWRTRCRAGLARARARLGPPGATRRAAGHTLALACGPSGAARP